MGHQNLDEQFERVGLVKIAGDSLKISYLSAKLFLVIGGSLTTTSIAPIKHAKFCCTHKAPNAFVIQFKASISRATPFLLLFPTLSSNQLIET